MPLVVVDKFHVHGRFAQNIKRCSPRITNRISRLKVPYFGSFLSEKISGHPNDSFAAMNTQPRKSRVTIG